MRKVVFTISCLGIGGAERVVSILASKMAEMGYDVTVLALLKKDCKYPLSNKVKYRYIGDESKSKAVKVYSIIKKLRKEIKNINPDIVFSFLVLPNILTIWSTRFLKCKIIVSERNDPYRSPNNKWIRKLRDFSYNFADGFVFQTVDAQNYFRKKIAEKGVVIPNPVKANMPYPYEGDRRPCVVAVGQLLPQKNFEMLIDGFNEFKALHPEYTLEIYGDGVLENELKDRCKKLQIEQAVFFKGFCEDVHEKIRDASIYVSTSNYEGISNSMLEALAMGIPSVVTDCPIGGARMVIRNEENGVLIEVNNRKQLVQAMDKIASNDIFSAKLSRNAVNIKNEYSEDSIVNRWLALL